MSRVRRSEDFRMWHYHERDSRRQLHPWRDSCAKRGLSRGSAAGKLKIRCWESRYNNIGTSDDLALGSFGTLHLACIIDWFMF
ncbi:hypothetical protein CRE_11506 [Caenorhabditis remanei]|uniref:Uncharacterized protein n=1 Tax=Caenorhabditis remanei TaxID=31234 RepID=E3NIL3_CAERE|nr:hypothetical protein CRE_11506 [Caenorhabditis remanei]